MGLGDKVRSLVRGKDHLILPTAIFAAASLVDIGLTYYGITSNRSTENNFIIPLSNYFANNYGPKSLILLKAAGFGIIVPLAARVDYIARLKNYKIHGPTILNTASIYTTSACVFNLTILLT